MPNTNRKAEDSAKKAVRVVTNRLSYRHKTGIQRVLWGLVCQPKPPLIRRRADILAKASVMHIITKVSTGLGVSPNAAKQLVSNEIEGFMGDIQKKLAEAKAAHGVLEELARKAVDEECREATQREGDPVEFIWNKRCKDILNARLNTSIPPENWTEIACYYIRRCLIAKRFGVHATYPRESAEDTGAQE